MRNVENIQINEMFVHILNNRKSKLIKSDFPIQFKGDDELWKYFTGHIVNSLRDPSAKAAKFKNINQEQASGVCRDILSGATTLAHGSQDLAQLLFDITKKDQRISPADLGVCLYHDVEKPKDRYLAILKIDPSEVFQHKVTHEQNKIRIAYQVNTEALTKEKLQKCAFIRSLDPRDPEYDMLLLDRQAGTVGDGVVALFFAERFLDAVDALDATKRTKLFYKTVMDTLNAMRDILPPEVSQELDQRLTTAIGGRSLNVNTWLNQLPIDEKTQEIFRKAIREKITDIEFEPDAKIGGQFAGWVVYQGDHNFRITIPSKYYHDLVQPIRKIQTPDGEMNEVIIHTKYWKAVSK